MQRSPRQRSVRHVDWMQTRGEPYDVIGPNDYDALSASIVWTIVPEAAPQVQPP